MQELEECNRVLGEIAEIVAQKAERKGGFEKEAKLVGYFTRLQILVDALPQSPRKPGENSARRRPGTEKTGTLQFENRNTGSERSSHTKGSSNAPGGDENPGSRRCKMQRHLVVAKRIVDLLLRRPDHRHCDSLLLLISSYI